VVASGEAPLAHLAFEGFGACVFPDVASEFVRAREPPQAVLISARVGLLTRVNSLMRLEMRTFRVNFGATWMIAVMNPSFLQFWIISAIVFDDLTSRFGSERQRVLRRSSGRG